MKSFIQLSYRDREKIYRGLCQQKSYTEIAFSLDRSTSTISREIRRNSDQYGYLYPNDAHKNTALRRNKNRKKIEKYRDLQNYVLEKLCERWSPRAIAGRWNKENNIKISTEAIYQWIYSKEGEALNLKKLLIRSRKKRGLMVKVKPSKIKNKVSIHERPEEINMRNEPGHWECDLMFNSGSQSQNICTFVDRYTRKACLILNQNKSTSCVIDSLIERIKSEKLDVKSITFDNGTEFAGHTRLNALGIKTYFCDPHSPWQKGSIENLNGILRRFLPFELPAADITEEYVYKINKQINSMPRAILGYKTPEELSDHAYGFFNFKESRMKTALPAGEAVSYNQKGLNIAFQH
jgi:IS30 family transposase